MDEDRNIDETPASIPVVIDPPFWERSEYLGPIGALGVMALLSLVFLYRNHAALVYSGVNLRRSEAGLADAQRIAQVGSWDWDVTHGTVVCSDELHRIFGVSPQSGPVAMPQLLERIHPDDRFEVDEAIRRSLQEREPFKCIHRIIRPNGEIRHLIQLGEVVTNESRTQVHFVGTTQDITEQKQSEAIRERLIGELQEALAHIKTLSGLLPICSTCKRIRDDSGYWNQIETYIKDHSDAEFTHGICPECAKKIYGVDELMGGKE